MSSPLDTLPQPELRQVLGQAAHPLVFATVSGAHLYGFPSVDSDFDLRGSHLLPGRHFWGLEAPEETLQWEQETAAGLIEAVTHDLRKFARLLLKRNGYVLEQLTSPLVLVTSPVHQELLALAPDLLTRHHYHHYRGFYYSERKEYLRSEPKSLKRLLYCFRVLMTGCVLLREGVVEANLSHLNRRFELPFLDELIQRKIAGELGSIQDEPRFGQELDRLEAELDRAFAETTLPESPPARPAVHELVVRAREQA